MKWSRRNCSLNLTSHDSVYCVILKVRLWIEWSYTWRECQRLAQEHLGSSGQQQPQINLKLLVPINTADMKTNPLKADVKESVACISINPHTRPAASLPPSSSRTHPRFWLRSAVWAAAGGWCTLDPHPDAEARRRSGWCKTERSSLWLAPPPPPESGPTAPWRRSPHSSAAGWSPWRSGSYRTRRPLEAWLGFIAASPLGSVRFKAPGESRPAAAEAVAAEREGSGGWDRQVGHAPAAKHPLCCILPPPRLCDRACIAETFQGK